MLFKNYFSQDNCLMIFTKPAIIYGFLALVLLAGLGVHRLKISANYRVYFNPDAAIIEQEKLLSQRYYSSDNLLLVITSQSSMMLEDNWFAVDEFSNQLLKLDTVSRVNSFIRLSRLTDNAPVSDDPDYINEFDSNMLKLSQSDSARLSRLLEHPRAKYLISQDGKSATLDLQVKLSNPNSAKQVLQFISSIDLLIDQFSQQNSFVSKVHSGGIQSLNGAYISVVRHDLMFFIPLLFLVFGFGLYYFFRSVRIVAVVLLLGAISTFGAFGLAGWLGLELAAINAFSPVIIVSLSIATSVHLITSYFRYLLLQRGSEYAIKLSLSNNFLAIFLSNLTTAGGFMLLSTSPSPPIRIVGYIVAAGVLVSYLASQIILPILLKRACRDSDQPVIQQINTRWDLTSLGKRLLHATKPILILVLSVSLLSMLALSNMQVNDNVYEYFAEGHPFKQANKVIQKDLPGVSRLYFSIDSGEEFGLFDKNYLAFVRQFSDWLKLQDEVAEVAHIDQLFQVQNKSLSRLKRNAKLVSVKELGLSREISVDFRHSKISVILKSTSTKEVLNLNKKSLAWINNNQRNYNTTGGVSPDLIFAQLGQTNSQSLFYSLLIALIIVALLVGIIFRSWQFILMALLCNILPLVLVYGLWFQLGGYLSLGSSVVMGMIMGILIDDTLHMLIKHHRYQQLKHQQPVIGLFSSVAPAVLITSLTLIAGLLIGLFSQFRPIVELSGLSAAIIFVALVIDLTLLPILMVKLSRTQILIQLGRQ